MELKPFLSQNCRLVPYPVVDAVEHHLVHLGHHGVALHVAKDLAFRVVSRAQCDLMIERKKVE